MRREYFIFRVSLPRILTVSTKQVSKYGNLEINETIGPMHCIVSSDVQDRINEQSVISSPLLLLPLLLPGMYHCLPLSPVAIKSPLLSVTNILSVFWQHVDNTPIILHRLSLRKVISHKWESRARHRATS